MSSPPPLDGRLHIYSEAKNLVCFESGDATANNVLAFYGGFGTGLYSMPVLADLSASLPPDWGLVQALSRSSYQGVLTAKQTETAEDMHDLEVYFRQAQHKTGRMVFAGASKGCNDVIAFFDTYGKSTTADAGILLSPTGGRENLLRYFTQDDLTSSITLASAQSEAGFGAYAFPPDVLNANKLLQSCKGMHADVWLHIMAAGGPAENFASDSTDEQLEDLFSSFRERSKHICILTAGDDETVPETVDKELLLRRFLRAAAGQSSIARGHVVKRASHAIEQEEARDMVVGEVVAFLGLTQRA